MSLDNNRFELLMFLVLNTKYSTHWVNYLLIYNKNIIVLKITYIYIKRFIIHKNIYANKITTIKKIKFKLKEYFYYIQSFLC